MLPKAKVPVLLYDVPTESFSCKKSTYKKSYLFSNLLPFFLVLNWLSKFYSGIVNKIFSCKNKLFWWIFDLPAEIPNTVEFVV